VKDVYSSLIRSLVLHYSSASSCFSTHTLPIVSPAVTCLELFSGQRAWGGDGGGAWGPRMHTAKMPRRFGA
jgi:hypothetical protein